MTNHFIIYCIKDNKIKTFSVKFNLNRKMKRIVLNDIIKSISCLPNTLEYKTIVNVLSTSLH